MDTNAIKALLETRGFHITIHQVGQCVELHASQLQQPAEIPPDPNLTDLKIVRTDGCSVRDIAVGMVELARMCGVNLL